MKATLVTVYQSSLNKIPECLRLEHPRSWHSNKPTFSKKGTYIMALGF